MTSKFKEMIEEAPDIHVTLDREDPNASRSEIVLKNEKNRQNLIRRSDASDKLIELQYKQDLHHYNVDTEPHDSPHSSSKFDIEAYAMSEKSNKAIWFSDHNENHTYGEISEPKSQLPLVNYYVPLLMSTNAIIDLFKQTSKQQNFQVIECQQSFATAVFKEPFSVKRWLFRCLPVFGGEEGDEDNSVSAVRMIITVNESKAWRKITIKGLYGKMSVIRNFIKFYNRKINNKVYKGVPKNIRAKRKESGKLTFDNNCNEISFVTDEEEKNPQNNGDDSSHQTSESSSKKFTYYYYHKILSSDQYSLGKKVAEFLKWFEVEYKSMKESSKQLPKPLTQTINMTNEIVSDLYSNYNISGNNKNLMQFCRASVEKYIFGKIYPKIFGMYLIKYEDVNAWFVKRSSIIKATDPITMLKHLGVNKKYIIWDNFQFSNSDQKYEFNNKIDSAKDAVEAAASESGSSDPPTPKSANGKLPYHESIKALERISWFTSPREKLDWVIEFFSNMKASIVDYWKGKLELQTMDDILPLIIYTVWYCNCSNFASEVHFLKDFLSETGNVADESIERTLFNIEMGIQYVNTTDEYPFTNKEVDV